MSCRDPGCPPSHRKSPTGWCRYTSRHHAHRDPNKHTQTQHTWLPCSSITATVRKLPALGGLVTALARSGAFTILTAESRAAGGSLPCARHSPPTLPLPWEDSQAHHLGVICSPPPSPAHCTMGNKGRADFSFASISLLAGRSLCPSHHHHPEYIQFKGTGPC